MFSENPKNIFAGFIFSRFCHYYAKLSFAKVKKYAILRKNLTIFKRTIQEIDTIRESKFCKILTVEILKPSVMKINSTKTPTRESF